MPGRATAVTPGNDLRRRVVEFGEGLSLVAKTEVKTGKRLWGAERRIDVVLTHVDSRKSLGVECKFQGGQGTAEEKIPTTIRDIDAWPIPGIVVIGGDGFSKNMRAYLYSTGKAVDIEDLKEWLKLYFGL
jgi:hypothetical protein